LHTKLNLFIFRLCFSIWRLRQDWRNYTLVLRQLTNAGQKGNGQRENANMQKKKKCGKLQQGPFIYQIVLVFPTQPLAINLKDRHKSNAFLALIKDAYCPHRFLFLQPFFLPFLQMPCHVRFKSNA